MDTQISMDEATEQSEANEPEIDLTSGQCPFSGSITYSFKSNQVWPSGAKEKLTEALDEALWYYNCYADLTHTLTINYKPDVPTAEANVDGLISFGQNQQYMVTATAMHEIAHTMGVGFPPFLQLTDDNMRWTGPAVKKVIENIPPEQSDPGARRYITADKYHFWPYGLNQADEHESEWSLINHVRIVTAIREDLQNF